MTIEGERQEPDDRLDLRDRAVTLMEDLYTELAKRGFEPYRRVEMMHPESGRHVRRGFSGGEWTITVSDIPVRRNGRRGVSSDTVPRCVIRLDLLHLARVRRGLPSVEDLIARIL